MGKNCNKVENVSTIPKPNKDQTTSDDASLASKNSPLIITNTDCKSINSLICNEYSTLNQITQPTSMHKDHTGNIKSINENSVTELIIFHQNIRGLNHKIDELLNCWSIEFPHVICITEHHLQEYEINSTHIEHYNLGATQCRKFCKHGGVDIFLHETLSFSTTDLSKFCNRQDLEICAVQLNILSSVLRILCI